MGLPLNILFDVARIKLLKKKAAGILQKDRLYLEVIEKELMIRLQFTKRDFKNILIYGEFSNDFLMFLKQCYSNQVSLVIANIVPFMLTSDLHNPVIACYEEQLPFPAETFDLVISCASFHYLNNIPKALEEYKRVLKPDGFFLSSFVGGNTLHEMRDALLQSEIMLTGGASPRVIPMVDLLTAANLIQNSGFSFPVVDRDLLNISYSAFNRLLKDLKLLGENNYMNARSLKIPPKHLFKLAEQYYYQQHLDEHQRLKVTLELIHLCGWNPDPSQSNQPIKGTK